MSITISGITDNDLIERLNADAVGISPPLDDHLARRYAVGYMGYSPTAHASFIELLEEEARQRGLKPKSAYEITVGEKIPVGWVGLMLVRDISHSGNGRMVLGAKYRTIETRLRYNTFQDKQLYGVKERTKALGSYINEIAQGYPNR